MPMSEYDKNAFMIEMNKMSVVFGTAELPKPKLQLIFEALQDLSIDAIKAGCASIIKNESRFPVPKTIREHADLFTKRNTETDYKKLNLFRHEPASQFGKDCLKNITDLFDGKISKEEYLTKAIYLTESIGEDSTELEFQLNGGCPF